MTKKREQKRDEVREGAGLMKQMAKEKGDRETDKLRKRTEERRNR